MRRRVPGCLAKFPGVSRNLPEARRNFPARPRTFGSQAEFRGAPPRIFERLAELCRVSPDLPEPCGIFRHLPEFSNAPQNLEASRRIFLRLGIRFQEAPENSGSRDQILWSAASSAKRRKVMRITRSFWGAPEKSRRRWNLLRGAGKLWEPLENSAKRCQDSARRRNFLGSVPKF